MIDVCRCDQVVWHEVDEETKRLLPRLGDVVWDPKMGEGHFLLRVNRCSEKYCGYCAGLIGDHEYADCECGQVDIDHHVYVLDRGEVCDLVGPTQ